MKFMITLAPSVAFVHVCVCVCVRVCVYMCVCVRARVCVCVCDVCDVCSIYVCSYVYECEYVCLYICVCMCVLDGFNFVAVMEESHTDDPYACSTIGFTTLFKNHVSYHLCINIVPNICTEVWLA